MTTFTPPVDAVITWVDGQDPAHAQKLANYLLKLGIARPEGAAPTRFQQCGEIDYCVLSLLRFAPWLRTIFIVTDAQTPPIVQKLQNSAVAAKIKLIDHTTIFNGMEHCLPTFNSLAIESVLWRIAGLAENFIYFNDDTFLIRPVQYEHFFKKHALAVRGSWKTAHEYKWSYRVKNCLKRYLQWPTTALSCDEHRALQERSAALAGFQGKFFHLPHLPFALKKSAFATFFQANPQLLTANAAHPFRNAEQFWPISLAQHLAIKNHATINDKDLQAVYVHAGNHSVKKIRTRLAHADKSPNIAFVCMQSLDLGTDYVRKFMLDWLHNRIGNIIHDNCIACYRE